MFRISLSCLLSLAVLAAFTLVWAGPVVQAADPALGDFEAQADVGSVDPPGAVEFDKSTRQYRISSSGQNIWAKHDDFHFVYRKVWGDLVLTADIAFIGEGKNAHRKAGWMVRQDLGPDAPYVDVMLHGDGSIALQYRSAKGEATSGIKSEIKAPATVRLERHGDTFSLYAAPKADKDPEFKLMGTIKVTLADPVYAGLAVSAHDATTTETAVFSGVTLKNEAAQPKPAPGK